MVSSHVQAATKEWVSLGVGWGGGGGGGWGCEVSNICKAEFSKHEIYSILFLSNDVIYEIIGEHDLRTYCILTGGGRWGGGG
jgi:hypothetical protein